MIESILVNTLNGLSYGFIVFLIAVGLTITMGLMRLLNLAHGALYAIGSYMSWSLTSQIGFNFYVSISIAALTVGILAFVFEWLPLKGMIQDLDRQVLLTLGYTYIVTNAIIWRWTGEPQSPIYPNALHGSLDIGVSYPKSRLLLVIVGFVLAMLVWLIQERTLLGAKVKAGMDDIDIARALGIDVKRVAMLVFVGASMLAGVAGGFGQMIMGNQPGFVMEMLTTALIVVIVGGVGSVPGALLASLILGMVDSFGTALAPQYAAFTPFIVMIIMLAVKPQGLMGRKEARAY